MNVEDENLPFTNIAEATKVDAIHAKAMDWIAADAASKIDPVTIKPKNKNVLF